MSAVDIGQVARARAPGEFIAPARSRRLAVFCAAYTAVVCAVVLARGLRRSALLEMDDAGAVRLVVPLFALCVALVALATRSARLRIDADGVRFGWGDLVGFSLKPARIRLLRLYDDGIGVVTQRGVPWFLAASDWHPFKAVRTACRLSGLPVESVPGRAPFRARMQGYGRLLDLFLVANLVLVTLAIL